MRLVGWSAAALDECANNRNASAQHRCGAGRRQSDELADNAFVACSIIAASGTSLVSGRFGNRRAFSGGAVIYAAGAVLCASAPAIGFVIAGRCVQGLGGGLLSALAYVLVRNAFPERLWPRVFGLLAGVWSVTVLIGPLIGGVFASYGIGAARLSRSQGSGACSVLARFLRFPPTARMTRASAGLFRRDALP
jgi:MFS family permease